MLLKKSWDKVRVATQQSHQSRDERKLVSLLFWEMMDSDPRQVPCDKIIEWFLLSGGIIK